MFGSFRKHINTERSDASPEFNGESKLPFVDENLVDIGVN